MSTIYYTASSLDGFLTDAQGSMDWLFRHDRAADRPSSYERFIEQVGALAMGRGTFDWILAQQPEAAVEGLYEQPTWVVTHRPVPVLPPRVRVHEGDVRPLHAAMTEAAGGKDVWVVGGGDLAGQLADAGLLDEVWVQLAPVTAGGGAALLPRRIDLELVDAERNGDFVDVRYRVHR